MISPILYFIRHGEKWPKVDGVHPLGLSSQGVERSQCLRKVFGAESKYDIGHIMAQLYYEDGNRKRCYSTVLPLAEDLGLKVYTATDRDDHAGAVQKVFEWIKMVESGEKKGNLLLCWNHGEISHIVRAMGIRGYGNKVSDEVKKLGCTSDGEIAYPDDRFDVIWTIKPPYQEITSVTSEECEGLDDGHVNP